MAKIVILGAGRSAYHTIQYLVNESSKIKSLEILVADNNPKIIEELRIIYPNTAFFCGDLMDSTVVNYLLRECSVAISLLPARFHIEVAKVCLGKNCHLITPSYLSTEMQSLNVDAKVKGLIFLNELGLDPGIDHLSALELIHKIQRKGGKITSFKSWCGGLIAKESDTNPWHYKLSWNPYNVIRAGQDGAVFLNNKKNRYIPYHKLFEAIEDVKSISGEIFSGYYNRNSLPYMETYHLNDCETFLRGTLRYDGFCSAWDFLVKTGITSDKLSIPITKGTTLKQYFNWFINERQSLIENFTLETNTIPFKNQIEALEFLGINSDVTIPFEEATPAQVLEWILTSAWKLNPEDKDRVVMIHQLEYELGGSKYKTTSELDLNGTDSKETAMSKTVGLPLALAAMLILDEKIKEKGVMIPIKEEIYLPLLIELKKSGIYFKEETIQIN